MLSLVVTALSFCVMLLISGNFIVGAWRERQRQKRAGRQQLIPHTAFHQTAMHISWAQVTHKTGMGKPVSSTWVQFTSLVVRSSSHTGLARFFRAPGTGAFRAEWPGRWSITESGKKLESSGRFRPCF